MIARLLAAGTGLWLMASPALLDYGDPAAGVDRIVGPIAASVSVIALSQVMRELRWLTLPLALVLLLAPLALGYGQTASINSLASAAVLAATAFFAPTRRYSFGGGWKVLFR